MFTRPNDCFAMDLPSKKVFDILLDKGIRYLHHANSVVTSCQFLLNNALLSRGTIERRRLFQTPQSSDEQDRKYNVWFDIFTDSVDIHDRARRPNVYGPVLFVFNIEALRESWVGRIWITKCNPTKWAGLPDDERWFRSLREVERDFKRGTFDQMIVFRHCGGELPFKGSVTEIVLDDPQMRTKKSDVELYSVAYGALKLSSLQGGAKIPIHRRECRDGCQCVKAFAKSRDETIAMFAPQLP
jgi:hypothetical protein